MSCSLDQWKNLTAEEKKIWRQKARNFCANSLAQNTWRTLQCTDFVEKLAKKFYKVHSKAFQDVKRGFL